jgi:hypothetical protein
MRTIVDEHAMHAEWNDRNLIEGRVRLRDAAAMSIPASYPSPFRAISCLPVPPHLYANNREQRLELCSESAMERHSAAPVGRKGGRKKERNGVVQRAVQKQHCNCIAIHNQIEFYLEIGDAIGHLWHRVERWRAGDRRLLDVVIPWAFPERPRWWWWCPHCPDS